MKKIPTHFRRAQSRGMSLIFSLVTLVALSLAAVALVRSVDSGTLILGNLGFKQDSQQAADDAARTAVRWLTENIASTLINDDAPGNGYYATTRDTTAAPLDATNKGSGTARTVIDWGSGCGAVASSQCLQTVAVPALNAGVTARYVILRLCDGTGDPTAVTATMNCVRPLVNGTSESGERGSLSYATAQRIGVTTVSQYFRVLVRSQGGRDTVTYTETLVHY
ncbi:MAG: hypothetical protein ABI574_06495 [Burkholderiales bacterium]